MSNYVRRPCSAVLSTMKRNLRLMRIWYGVRSTCTCINCMNCIRAEFRAKFPLTKRVYTILNKDSVAIEVYGKP